MTVQDQLREALSRAPHFTEREHNKTFTVQNPVYEVLYGGGSRDARGFRHRWHVIIWGGPVIVPNAEEVLSLAMRRAADAVLPLDCVIPQSIEVSMEAPINTDYKFTRGVIVCDEAEIDNDG